jgi:hypothetical protein
LVLFWFIIVTATIFLLSLFNFPAGFDDFNNAVLVSKKGNWLFNTYVYNEWSGRYSLSVILTYLNPIEYGYWDSGIKVAPIITLVLLILSSLYFILSVFTKNMKYERALLYSLLFRTIFLYAVPSVSELIYWFTGAATYTSGIVFFLLFLGSIIRFSNSNVLGAKIFYLIIAVLCLIAAIGTNESALMAMILSTFIILVASFIIHSKNRLFFILVFAITIAAALFSIKAPGNTVRSLGMHNGESIYSFQKLLKAISQSLYFTTVNAVGWMNNFALIITSLLFTPAALALMRQNLWLKKVTSVHPLLSLFLTIIFLSVQAFPSYLGMTDVDPRVWSSIYFFFLLSWFFNWLVLVNFFKARIENYDYTKLAPLKVVLVLILLFSAQGNINQAYLDLVTRAPLYSANLRERYKLIEASKGKDLVVPPIFERLYKYPKTIYSTDITTNTGDYRNTSLSEYFGLKSIRLSKEPVR